KSTFRSAEKGPPRSIELEPGNAAAFASLGFLVLQRGEQGESEKLLRHALALDPSNYPATYDLGRLYVRLARYDEAVSLLTRGTSLSGNDPGVHYQLFLAYSRLKKREDADRELALFKRLEEERKRADEGQGSVKTPSSDILPPPAPGDLV